MPVAANNSPELALLLTIARVELLPSEKSVLGDLLAGPLDWEFLLSMAAQHGLEPLLFHHLHLFEDGIVPARIMQALREDCKIIAGRNLILASRLKDISAHLRSREIEHIAYRGPLLAEVYYGSCTLRVFRDLDILVQATKVEAARDALSEIGFRDKCGLSASQQGASFRFGFEHPFTAAGGLDLDPPLAFGSEVQGPLSGYGGYMEARDHGLFVGPRGADLLRGGFGSSAVSPCRPSWMDPVIAHVRHCSTVPDSPAARLGYRGQSPWRFKYHADCLRELVSAATVLGLTDP